MKDRNNYHRCKVCKGLFADSECELDPVKGLICPKGCLEPFEQPAYESPLQE